MKKLLGLFFVPLVPLACQSPAPPEPQDPVAVEAAITDLWNQYAAFGEAGDAAGCASLFTEDAINRAAPLMRQRGRNEIQALFEGAFAASRWELIDRRTEEVLVSGDLAVEFGFLDHRFISATDTTTHNSQYVSVLKRQSDGRWLFYSWMGDND